MAAPANGHARGEMSVQRWIVLKFVLFCLAAAGPLGLGSAAAASSDSSDVAALPGTAKTCTLQIEINDAIGSATTDLISRAMTRAKQESCQSILVLINTPGGSLQSTRIIVSDIL